MSMLRGKVKVDRKIVPRRLVVGGEILSKTQSGWEAFDRPVKLKQKSGKLLTLLREVKKEEAEGESQ